MRVDPSGSHTPLTQTTANPAPRTAATRPTEPAPGGSSPEIETFVPTVELARLLQLVRQAPDVRPDVVAEVAARLAAGELNTPAAAADAARALIEEAKQNG